MSTYNSWSLLNGLRAPCTHHSVVSLHAFALPSLFLDSSLEDSAQCFPSVESSVEPSLSPQPNWAFLLPPHPRTLSTPLLKYVHKLWQLSMNLSDLLDWDLQAKDWLILMCIPSSQNRSWFTVNAGGGGCWMNEFWIHKAYFWTFQDRKLGFQERRLWDGCNYHEISPCFFFLTYPDKRTACNTDKWTGGDVALA